MKHFSIKSTKVDRKTEIKEREEGDCGKKDCSEKAIAKIHGESFASFFCKNHEEEFVSTYKQIELLNFSGSVHVKLTYFDPQPIPQDIQILVNRLNIQGAELYSVDKLSLDGVRAALNDALRAGSFHEGEKDVSLSEENEN